MEVWRGPKQKTFPDGYELTDENCDLAERCSLWDDEVKVEVEVSKEPNVRFAVAALFFRVKDVLDLNAKLIEALSSEITLLRSKAEKTAKYEDLLFRVRIATDEAQERNHSSEKIVSELRRLLSQDENPRFRS